MLVDALGFLTPEELERAMEQRQSRTSQLSVVIEGLAQASEQVERFRKGCMSVKC